MSEEQISTPVVISGKEQIKVITIENGAGFIENGAGFIKAGFYGEHEPRFIFPSSSGKGQKIPEKSDKLEAKSETTNQKNLKLENMETVWRETFYNKLQIEPSEYPVLLTVPFLTTEDDKEIMTEIMFNKFNVRDLYIATDAVLALLATGRKTGIVLHSTEDATHIVPIQYGQAITDAIKRFNICGRDLTDYLMKLLEKCYSFNDSNRSVVNDIKKKFCYVANNYLYEVANFEIYNNSKNYDEMPGGEAITIGVEQITCPEVLFNPVLKADPNAPVPTSPKPVGIHEVIYNSIMECDADIQKDLFGNIILSGENTVFPGFAERLQNELDILANDQMRIKVQKNLAWIGGSDLSSLESFKELFADFRRDIK